MNGSCGEFYGAVRSTVETVFYTIINVTIIIVASVLNITIIVMIKTRPVLHKPSFILLGALACSDLAMVCMGGVLYLTTTLKGMPAEGAIVTCVIISSINVNTLLLLCCITYDRYQCIKHSMDSRPYTSMRRVCIKIGLCITTSVIVSMTFYIESVYTLPFRTVEYLFIFILGCFFYITLYYIKLSRVIRRKRINSTIFGPQDSIGRYMGRIPSHHSNVNKSIFLLIASYIVAFFPGAVTGSIRNVSYRLNVQPPKDVIFATVWSATFSLSNSVMDPLIYTYRSDVMGRELRKVLLYIFLFCPCNINNTKIFIYESGL